MATVLKPAQKSKLIGCYKKKPPRNDASGFDFTDG